VPDPTTPDTTQVDITPQPQGGAAPNPLDAILNDPASLERLLSHPIVNARLNQVASAHVARIRPAAPAAPQSSEPKPVDGRLADLERSLTEERNARLALERTRAEESLDRTLEEVLRAKGVRPELVPAAHALLRARSIRRAEDGTVRLLVRRVRSQGQPAQELEYEDLGQGVADWLQDSAAQAFLPAPAPIGQRIVRPLAVNPATGRAVLEAPKGNSIAASDAALADLLSRSGAHL
jgi:hypothetical protein